MIVLWTYILGMVVAFPKVARWVLEDAKQSNMRRFKETSTGDYIGSIGLGLGGAVIWPVFAVVLGVRWLAMNLIGPIVFPELREKSGFWQKLKFKRKVKNGK